jgi:hypothetical protein
MMPPDYCQLWKDAEKACAEKDAEIARLNQVAAHDETMHFRALEAAAKLREAAEARATAVQHRLREQIEATKALLPYVDRATAAGLAAAMSAASEPKEPTP